VKVIVVRPGELGPDERRHWESFAQQSALTNPFLSWEFTQVIGQTRDDARVAVLDSGSGICGFLAFQVGPDRVGRPIGATIADAQAVVCPPDFDFNARELMVGAGLDSWQFDHLLVSQQPFVAYHRQLHRAPVVDLRAGHEQFLERLRSHSSDLLAQVARRRRKLEREIGPVVVEWQSTQRSQDIEHLRRWKTEQYARTGTWDRFGQPWIVEALANLAQSTDPNCTGALGVLRAGDQLVAAHLGLLSSGRLSWWFPTYDPEFSRYSPGLILLLDLIGEAAKRAIAMVDLGRGEHAYKLRVTSDFEEVAEGEVVVAGT
jgi:CelD/BcsL family acetyltransferase involved in cellulose biosynthesis